MFLRDLSKKESEFISDSFFRYQEGAARVRRKRTRHDEGTYLGSLMG